MAQGRVRQVGGGVVGPRALAPLGIHQQTHPLALGQAALQHP